MNIKVNTLLTIMSVVLFLFISCKNESSIRHNNYFFKPNGLSYKLLFESKEGFNLWFDNSIGDVVNYKQLNRFHKSFEVFENKKLFKIQMVFNLPNKLNVKIESNTKEADILSFRRKLQASLSKLNKLNAVFLKNNFDTAINFFYTKSEDNYYHFYNYLGPLENHILKFTTYNNFVTDTTYKFGKFTNYDFIVNIYNKVMLLNSELNHGKKSEGIYYTYTQNESNLLLSPVNLYVSYKNIDYTNFNKNYKIESISANNFLHLHYKGSNVDYNIAAWVANYYAKQMGLQKNEDVLITPLYNPLIQKDSTQWESVIMKILRE